MHKSKIVMNVSEAIPGCSTGQIAGLSQQVIEEILKMKPNLLSKISHKLIDCSGDQNNPYLQTNAYINLVRAVEERGARMLINSCLRTNMQQHMLRRQYEQGLCGIMAAARPGASNHNSGLAVDIEDASGWRPYLERHNWLWIGSFDPMHFDYSGGGDNLAYYQNLAFQRLWNKHNPKERLVEDGAWGDKTASFVARSPVEGFGMPEVLRKGMTSVNVGNLQLALRQKLNLTPDQLSADGRFGSGTQKYLAQYQGANGLIADGVAGPETLKKLGLA
jgi:hypothetical protein